MKQELPANPAHSIRDLKNCRVCGSNYGADKIRLIDRNEIGAVAHITCSVCVHSALVFFGKTAHGLGFLGMMTDLNFADAERFRGRPKISENFLYAANECLTTKSRQLVAAIYYQ
ncbi:MAG: hypothetical protein A2821_01255 [Candidatus Magasanikbacteria bacterium RIFCSPHIGHO2_01_FULL_41_23]|uniref:Uncharacterized protein n=1 Tax=Candidatus Magasanikbacteria bacterium RIFCSPLOWO2_01_FULL_40_15 TaxID=1798686 RepID=A0A1F6N4N6_9BACT|nr:MAG: hypothetical protein A2821_01255 [Candidatus Magasanikbacteria bacterium RIFCSPHIGHO2_01_FULL_41_23]OGH66753.1 MAG: hypothetical protein A3C66_01560 [Candidatus Magasanikbacteria bacterium RIFCSPHIGHO2_02_FULL_41_35]OGH74552.1 MAG: hypothetical protein A3F22_02965 [Candidatus Magasanikbacteria bacterium RIFCSPHIGHO2_12_FULL_41_16]OGH78841.1 MAG: hypothetical protein A2983_00715 [Candidatus Magasanikbacteria bacterium RIFCSPLOWO2_01_FULL_40_15]